VTTGLQHPDREGRREKILPLPTPSIPRRHRSPSGHGIERSAVHRGTAVRRALLPREAPRCGPSTLAPVVYSPERTHGLRENESLTIYIAYRYEYDIPGV
jgi:hypothetical protein